jgi:hypothetical protein
VEGVPRHPAATRRSRSGGGLTARGTRADTDSGGVWNHVRIAILAVIGLLTACTAEPSATVERVEASDAVRPTTSSAAASSSPAAASASVPPIDDLLPVELGGTELHTFQTGRDLLGRLAVELGLAPDDLEVDYASEHGARFLQMYAIRAPGTSGAELADAARAAAYLPSIGTIQATEETIGGRAVTVVHSEAEAPFVGTFFITTTGDTLLVVQAMERSIAEEALASLP